MEGFTPTLVLSLVACLTIGAASLVLFLVAGWRFFSGRPALKPFATAVLCALASAGFMGLAEASEGRHWSLIHLLALCLISAGIGQFITVRRNPGRYPTSLACAIGASALALGPLTSMLSAYMASCGSRRRGLFTAHGRQFGRLAATGGRTEAAVPIARARQSGTGRLRVDGIHDRQLSP